VAVLVSAAYAAGQQSQRASARIAPLEERQLTDAQREMLGSYARPGQTLALFRVCVQTPELCNAWLPASRYFGTSPLSLRDRELLILRTCWLTKNEYTWGNHVAAAKRAGMTDDDLVRITQGPRAKGWSDADATLLQAADALHAEQFIPDPIWKSLSSRYSQRELSDFLFIAGQYTFVAMWARNAGLAMEPGAPGFPKK
jgi:alkylhydroperoxidase family enzyme